MNKEIKKGLVPKLRFSEFLNAGEWNEKPLGKIAEIITGNTPQTSDSDNYVGNKMFVSPVDISDSRYIVKTKTTLSELGYSKTRHIPANSILFVCIGSTIGKIAQNKFDCATNQQINSVVPFKNYSSDFLYFALDNDSSRIAELAGRQAVPIINKSSFSAVSINIPPEEKEQTKIAACLSSLDDLITAQTQKIEALKTHKKGLMQQLFPQEGETVPKLRFPEFRDSGEWECTTIGEVGKFYYGKSAPKWSLSNDAPTLCVRYGELYTKFGTIISEILSRTNIDPSNLKFSKGGEILVPRVGEVPQDFAKNCCYLPFPNIAIGEMISVYETKEYPIFYTYYFRTMEQQFSRVVEGQNVKNLYYVNLEPIIIGKPSIPEQTKIADCFSSLDELIYSQVKKLGALKLHKKGLMQGLFPSSNEAA